MSAAKISIRIDADGNAHFDVAGVAGTSCESLTDLLVRGLGDIEEQHYTEEYCQELPDYVEAQESEE